MGDYGYDRWKSKALNLCAALRDRGVVRDWPALRGVVKELEEQETAAPEIPERRVDAPKKLKVLVPLSSLQEGTVFRLDRRMYIKVASDAENYFEVVDIEDGSWHEFTDADVQPIVLQVSYPLTKALQE